MFSDFDECLVRFSFHIEKSIILTNRYTTLLCQFNHLTHDLDFGASSLCSPSFSYHVFLNMRTFKDDIPITAAQIVGVYYTGCKDFPNVQANMKS